MHLLNTLPQRLDPGATPTFAGLIAPSLTAPASTNLTLGTGTSGAAITVLSASNNVGIGTTSPGSTLTLATVDTLLKPALGLRQANALAYGYDFDTETASVGRLDLYRVSNNVRTQMMSWRQNTGDVSIGSTTAGSSGAGALVVQGGISAGNTGVASYFGGDVTVSKASPVVTLTNTSASTTAQFLAQSTVARSIIIGQFGDGSGGTTLGIANAAGSYIQTATTGANYPDKLVISTQGRPAPIYFGTNNTLALTLDGTTQAATFAGAVTIGNTVNSVSPTSPNRTVTMVVNGVTLYLAAKTTND